MRNLADPIHIDSTNPDDPMAQLAVVLLALFGQMERTYALERAAHARAVATTKGASALCSAMAAMDERTPRLGLMVMNLPWTTAVLLTAIGVLALGRERCANANA